MRASHRLAALLLSVSVLIGIPSRATADPIVLASAFIEHGAGFDPARMSETGRFIFAVTPIANVQLFSEYLLTSADVGRTFVANAGNDPDFAEVARQLTNGWGNYNETQFATEGGTAATGRASEGPLFNLTTPDFHGFRIDALTFRVDSFGVEPYFGGQVLWLRGTLSVLGEAGADDIAPTPEPASLLLLGTGLAAVYARRRASPRPLSHRSAEAGD